MSDPTFARPTSDPAMSDSVAPAAVETVDVTRVYSLDGVAIEALRGVSVRIDPGEFVAIVGPSGSGKSTLMHLLGCLDRPSSGSLRVAGRDVAGMDDSELARLRNERIGFVFQSFQLLARTNAVDNVALPLVYRGLRRGERRRLAVAALEAVGLGHRLDHHPVQLSGGEQQRVAIARALVGGPALLLADEPTGNLDSRTGAEVMGMLERLNAERGVALVLVTHDADVAARAHRQVQMRDGYVERDSAVTGSPMTIAQRRGAERTERMGREARPETPVFPQTRQTVPPR
jgi:putative ABC transport system ATP-binding protein